MTEEKHQYLIKNKMWDNYLQVGSDKVYMPLGKDSVHEEIPSWINEDDRHLEVIRSDSEKFKDLAKHFELGLD